MEMPDDPADAPVYKKKGGSIPLIIGIILISLLIVGGGGYLLYSQVFAPSKEASKDLEELDEKEEKTVDADEVDLVRLILMLPKTVIVHWPEMLRRHRMAQRF